uniref:Uncharacterized protein n=1 Tax=Pyxicephalus adspersus TaxID=30357 RepID=A0AAV3A380_PYXAD|nr:TPA: hypothetical protein GDO54_017602 [Pyxicephalus adspersus]
MADRTQLLQPISVLQIGPVVVTLLYIFHIFWSFCIHTNYYGKLPISTLLVDACWAYFSVAPCVSFNERYNCYEEGLNNLIPTDGMKIALGM